MNRETWLKSLKPGDRVQTVGNLDPSEVVLGTVIAVSTEDVTIYLESQSNIEYYELPDGDYDAEYEGNFRIEPLSEWRKEPPDERGWWWCYRVLGPEPFLREMFAVHCVNEHDEWGFWVPSGYIKAPLAGDCFWQKAHVPTPPMDEETDSSRAIPGE